MSCLESFDRLCRKIVSPTRHEINDQDMIERKFRGVVPPFELTKVKNSRNQKLSTIVFQKNDLFPTILYLHGNGGNKLQVLHLVKMAENQHFNFASFDFSACGKSEGEFITYGQQQVQDIKSVVDFLTNKYNIKILFFWGRSMGASIGLLYGAKYPSRVKAMILDSPFRSLQKVVLNVANSTQSILPTFLLNIGVFFVKYKVENIVNQKIFIVDYSLSFKLLQQQQIPLLFAYSTRDSVVKEEDVREMFQIYKGPKKITEFHCLHPQDRPKNFIFQSLDFMSNITISLFQRQKVHEGPQSTIQSFRFKNTSMLLNPRNKWNS